MNLNTPSKTHSSSITGCLLGMAVGDALGLPFEGIGPKRIANILRDKPLEHRFLFGKGFCSDDTEHAAMTALALITSKGNAEAFTGDLARRIKWWFARLPAGIGLATLRSCLKLLLGANPARSGVKSAGNGPAMRAPIIGLYAANDLDLLRDLVSRSTLMTHNDPRALQGALLIALATRLAATNPNAGKEPDAFLALAAQEVADPQLLEYTTTAITCARNQQSPQAFLDALKLKKGITGYINHTVPAVFYCWFRHPDNFRAAIETSVRLGGDTDTVAAITGGILGASLGPSSIPDSWTSNLAEWPANTQWLRQLSQGLATPAASPEPHELFWPTLLARNTFFTIVVLTHAARRLLPPY